MFMGAQTPILPVHSSTKQQHACILTEGVGFPLFMQQGGSSSFTYVCWCVTFKWRPSAFETAQNQCVRNVCRDIEIEFSRIPMPPAKRDVTGMTAGSILYRSCSPSLCRSHIAAGRVSEPDKGPMAREDIVPYMKWRFPPLLGQ